MKLKTFCLVLSAVTLVAPLTVKAQKSQTAAVKTAQAPAQKQTADKMLAFIPENVVSINGKVQIKRQELVEILKPQLQHAIKSGQDIQEAELKSFAVSMANNLAIQQIILEHVQKQGIKLDRAAAEKMLQEQKKNYGEEIFNKMLKEQNIKYDTLVTRIAEMTAIKAWQDNIIAMIPPVTETEMKSYYEKNKDNFKAEQTFSASHILVKFTGDQPSENEKKNALAKIRKIRTQLLEGADFAALAKKESDCPSKEQGGSLGEFPAGRMVPEFEQALKNMKENEISQPVLTQFGYHIIKAGPQKPARQKTYKEAELRIKSILTQQKNQTAMKKTVDEILKKNDIKILIP